MANDIRFKGDIWIQVWLETALEAEWRKFRACPVNPDLMPGHEIAQAWGYVMAGYFLMEEAFKAILHLRERRVDKTHVLHTLFTELPTEHQGTLREYYRDFLATFSHGRPLPFGELDAFLANLDGGNQRGSFDWRYFPIEESSNETVPVVSISIMHEIVYGCLRIIEHMSHSDRDPLDYTHSWRLRWFRKDKYIDWLTVRRNSDGWDRLGDRLEILWGPDYQGRHDYMVFRGEHWHDQFAPLPASGTLDIPVVDKTAEVDGFDAEAGFRSIGIVTHGRTRQPPESGHVMF